MNWKQTNQINRKQFNWKEHTSRITAEKKLVSDQIHHPGWRFSQEMEQTASKCARFALKIIFEAFSEGFKWLSQEMDQTTRQCKCSPGQKLAFEICQSIFLVQSANIQIMSFKLPMDCLIHINIGFCVFFQVDSYYFSARTPCSKYNVFVHVDSSMKSLHAYLSKWTPRISPNTNSLYFSKWTPCISQRGLHVFTWVLNQHIRTHARWELDRKMHVCLQIGWEGGAAVDWIEM